MVVDGVCGNGTYATDPTLVANINETSTINAKLGTALAGTPNTSYRLCYAPGE